MLIFSICINYFSSINFILQGSIFFVVRMNCIYVFSINGKAPLSAQVLYILER